MFTQIQHPMPVITLLRAQQVIETAGISAIEQFWWQNTNDARVNTYQQSMIQNHPMTLSRQQLEDIVAVDSLGMGPGMVEGYRFRGNLNL